MSIILPQPINFSFQECLWFLDRNYDDCLHEVGENRLRKLLKTEGGLCLIEVTEKDNSLLIKILQGNFHEKVVIDFVKEWMDFERDIQPFYDLLKQDADLTFMPTDYHGLRLLGIPDLFEALSWSIIGQQINLTFAYKLKRRLVETWGESVVYEGIQYYAFPAPSVIANLQVADFQDKQFSTRKVEYLIEIAQQFEKGNISKAILEKQTTPEAIETLVKIRGIGVWTANYALMKSLKRLECITYGDVGLYNALHKVKGFPRRPSKEEIDELFNNFKGWESYLVFYLWRSLA